MACRKQCKMTRSCPWLESGEKVAGHGLEIKTQQYLRRERRSRMFPAFYSISGRKKASIYHCEMMTTAD